VILTGEVLESIRRGGRPTEPRGSFINGVVLAFGEWVGEPGDG
jgi:hypothetical protein